MISDGKFPKSDHLRKTKEFDAVYRKGRSCRSSFLVLYALPNGFDRNRIGFSISSRKVRHAATRNRLRRLLREAFRRHKAFVKPGYDIVIAVTRAPAPVPGYEAILTLYKTLIDSARIAA